LHKCDDIVIISHGEIVDHGPYNELMNTSKILNELVHSIAVSEKEQYQRQASEAGKCVKYIDNSRKKIAMKF
jgi:ABC-type multidrug transport system ATPase subunit